MTLPAAYFDGDGDPNRLDQPSDHHDKHASWQTDASGNVTGLVGPDGNFIMRRGCDNNVIGQKLFGLAGSSAQSSVYTYYEKIAADAEYDAVQLVIYHHQATTPTFVAVVAATETSKTDSADNLFEPIVGGTKYQVKDSTSDKYGWRTVKWAGATSKQLTAGTATVPSITLSDWIPLPSVPRAAGELSTNPLLMVRMYASDAAAQNTTITTVNAAGRTETALNGGRIIQSGAYLGDGVGTINNTNRPGSLASSAFTFSVRFRSKKRGLLVMGAGDSITQNNAIATDIISCWGLQACAAASTDENPVSWWNHGQSSQGSSVYQPNLLTAAASILPNVIIYSPYSPNDYSSPNEGAMRYALMNAMARTEEVVDYCARNRISLILWTALPHSLGLSAAADTLRKSYNDTLRTLAPTVGATLVDFDAALSDGESPATILPAYNLDNIHPNAAGIAVMAGLMATALRGLI